MKTAEDIARQVFSEPVHDELDAIVKAMKLYANAKLDEAAEFVSTDKLDYVDYYDFSKGVETVDNSEREEILSLKDTI